MTDPGLNNRLRQHSRRAGLMVGLSMAATILICIGGFALVYGWLTPLLSDIVPVPTPQVAEEPVEAPAGAQVAQANQPDRANQAPAVAAAAEPPPPAPTEPPAPAPAPTATEEAFRPDYQVRSDQSVNLRPQPSSENTADNQPIRALPPATPLQYLNEDQPTTNPNDAPRWMRFRTEENEEGWIRELDVVPFEP